MFIFVNIRVAAENNMIKFVGLIPAWAGKFHSPFVENT